jgi:DNA-binding NtrC family response regulator
MKPRILIVDDEAAARHGLRRALESTPCDVLEAADGMAALEEIDRSGPDLLICDIRMPRLDGIGLMKALAERSEAPPVIMITAHGSERIAVDAMKAGAYDYLAKPYEVDELRAIVGNALEMVRLKRENQALRDELHRRSGYGSMIGRSRPMEQVYDLIAKVAGTDATVLVCGESGTGKELVARTVHAQSTRKDGPFVAMSAAALPTELIESEMFGHEKGAFTGAADRRLGKFELADGGTLFLDEVGDMGPETQAKLLRVLQERSFERLGGSETINVDVRVISATNKDLPSEIAAESFREDLYYRLRVVDITVPPLRERREDIPLLVHHFLEASSTQHGRAVTEVPPVVMKLLVDHPWPGNVRELAHAVERAVILSDADQTALEANLLPPEVQVTTGSPTASGQTFWSEGTSFQEAKQATVQSFETGFITSALERHGGNISRAATEMGMKRQALQQKLKELGIDPNAYR